MGKVDSSSTFSDNDWEEVKEKTESKIKEWIDEQLNMRSCLVVLIGEKTANRKWINYEIKKAYELNKGIVGIYIHKLENSLGEQDDKGNNPFDYLTLEGEKLSKYVKCFDSNYSSSKYVYSDIKESAIQAYKNNFGEDPKCDITQINPSNLPNFDFLLAGFPCQAFSQAGLGLGFQDTRGTLFF